jgi:hypothetical protein
MNGTSPLPAQVHADFPLTLCLYLKCLTLSCLLEIEKARNPFNNQLDFVLSSGEKNDYWFVCLLQ